MTRVDPPTCRTPRSRLVAVAALACAVVFTWSADSAEAKTQRTTYYSYEQVWPAVIRHLRVDEGFAIVEKDAEAGYVLFEVKDDGKSFRGALELVRVKDERERRALRLIVRIDDRPRYIEVGVLDRLERKLRDEYGAPPPSPPEKSQDEDKDSN